MTGGIAGISPIGFGLGTSPYGDFSNYLPSNMGMFGMNNGMMGGLDNLSAMGLNYGTGGLNYGMGYGMGGMLGYQQYMAQMQNNIDKMNLNHVAEMHTGVVNNEVQAHEDTFSGIIRKLMTDGDIQQRIYSLNRKVKEGDQKGVCEEYDKLKARVYSECATEFKGKGKAGHKSDLANQIIDSLYGNIISAREGTTHSLYQDIQKYGDTAFGTGFNAGFRGDGKRQTVGATINHIYGERTDHYGSKKRAQYLGTGVGTIAGVIKEGFLGAGVGAGAWILGSGIVATVPKAWGCGKGLFFNALKHTGKAAVLGGIIGMVWELVKRFDKSAKS